MYYSLYSVSKEHIIGTSMSVCLSRFSQQWDQAIKCGCTWTAGSICIPEARPIVVTQRCATVGFSGFNCTTITLDHIS
jgi:hypothetical protein